MTNTTVLVTITDLFFLSKIQTALENQGCAVRVTTQSQQILKEALDQKPSLLILDLGLSTVDPLLLIQELRRIPDLHNLPVLCYTNHTQVQNWEEKLKDNMTKVVPNSYISSHTDNLVGLLNLFK
ncbi:MAG: response regulator [Nitrospirae bacterium]|nr:response regulator [Nitrospirota bacterium]